MTPRGEIGTERFDELFPADACLRIFAELRVWTSVDDCLAAARMIEGRTRSTDSPSRVLIVPFEDSDGFEAVFVQCLRWFKRSYAVPEVKVRLAMEIDSAIAPRTASTLLETRFRPSVTSGPAGAIETIAPALSAHRHDRFFLVESDEHVSELIQNPLRCLTEIVGRAWSTASKLAGVRSGTEEETGGAPRIFHQPYTDGPLFALIEALAFYVCGLTIGPNAFPTEGINRGYRSVEIIGRPPIDSRMFDLAQKGTELMFRSLE